METITDAGSTKTICMKGNFSAIKPYYVTPAQAETLLYFLERAAAGIVLHVNAHKTE